MQLDDFFVEEWGYVDFLQEEDVPDWITFVNETINKGVRFEMSPAIIDIGKEYKMFVTLTDHNEEPESKVYEFSITVVPPTDEEKFQTSSNTTIIDSISKYVIRVQIT